MRQQRGLTIVECLIAMTILSIVVLVTCHTLTAGHAHVHYGDRVAGAARLAGDLLEEVAARDYRDADAPANFGRETGETTRSMLDDVDDYHEFAESAGSVRDFTDDLYPAHDQTCSRSVTVTAVDEFIPALGRTFPGRSVVVTVRAANGEQWEFSRFIPEPTP